MKIMNAASVLAVGVVAASVASGETLTTNFIGDNSFRGNAFDIRVGGSGITLTNLELNLASSSENVSFWYREGTYVGNLGTSDGWTRLDTQTLTTAEPPVGFGRRAEWDIADQAFQANTTYGIIIVSNSTGLAYSNTSSAPGTDAASDANLTIEHGVGLGSTTGFGGEIFTPRTWNGSFIYVVGIGPVAIDALVAATGTAVRLIVVGADGVARDAGQVSIATRNGQTTFTRVADGTGAGNVTISTSGAPGMVGNVYTWAEVTGFRSDTFGSGNGTLGGNGIQIGADIGIGPDMVAGLSLGYSQVNSSDKGFSTDGELTFLQPYFAYRSGAWHGNASLLYGIGSFDQTSLGGDGSADVRLAAVTFEGGYDYALAEGYTLTPTIGLIHVREEVEGTGGTLAGTSDDVTFSQASLGGRITHDGPDGTLFAGFHADYLTQDTDSILAADLLAEDGWTGRVEVGGEMALPNGMALSSSVELSGLGGDMQTVSGGLRVALRF